MPNRAPAVASATFLSILGAACGDPAATAGEATTQGDAADTTAAPVAGTDSTGSDPGGTTVDSTSTGAAASTTDVADSTGAGSGDGTSNGSDGGSTTAATDSGVAPCSTIEVSGSLDGDDLGQSLEGNGLLSPGALYWGLGNVFYFDPYAAGDGSSAPGVLRLADDAPAHAGEWFCADEATTLALSEDSAAFQLHLEGLTSLGVCPGDPVDGELSYTPDDGFASTLPGIDPTITTLGVLGANVSNVTYGMLVFDNGTFAEGTAFLQFPDITMLPGTTGTVHISAGSLRVPIDENGVAATYCFGAESTIDYELSVDEIGGLGLQVVGFHLTDFKQVPACPSETPVDGTLDVSFCPEDL